jgi:uncharacterized protein (TIGR03435 family)
MDVREYPTRLRLRSTLLVVRAMAVTVLLMTMSRSSLAQPDTSPPAFDVASIKRSQITANSSSISRSGGRITLENVSLRECISFAYGIPTGRDYELEGPDWIGQEKFNIAATFPPSTSRDRVREMLRTTLAERFKLKTHQESKEIKSFALVVGKHGPRLPAVSTATDGAFVWGNGKLTARAVSMSSLADRLSGPPFKLDQPVIDMTGIKGVYDFVLSWTPDDAIAEGPGSIFTALQEQLGLKLEARRIMSRIFVIDNAEKVPTEN